MGDFEILGIPISLGTMIYQATLFTILIFVLKKFYLSKLLNAMENRRESIANQLKLAETYKREAEEELQKQRARTEEINMEAREIMAKAREEASQMIKAARKDAFTIRTEAYEERSAKKERGAS